MKQILIITLIPFLIGCNSNKKQDILTQKNILLNEIADNSKEREKIKSRFEFIQIELTVLKNGLYTKENKNERVRGLVSEVKNLVIKNNQMRESDSLNLIKIDSLDAELENLK